jgi:benzodiazapine receptor
MKTSKSLKLIISILLCQAAGIIGSFFTRSSIESWYSTINKPGFTPPGWIFGPVWISLYLMMGISLFLVWKKAVETKNFSRKWITFFAIQLALNTLWSILFFGLHSPMLAFVEILLLWLFILLTLIEFRKISTAAGLLLIPYLFWVSFAAFLNFSIWRLN